MVLGRCHVVENIASTRAQSKIKIYFRFYRNVKETTIVVPYVPSYHKAVTYLGGKLGG